MRFGCLKIHLSTKIWWANMVAFLPKNFTQIFTARFVRLLYPYFLSCIVLFYLHSNHIPPFNAFRHFSGLVCAFSIAERLSCKPANSNFFVSGGWRRPPPDTVDTAESQHFSKSPTLLSHSPLSKTPSLQVSGPNSNFFFCPVGDGGGRRRTRPIPRNRDIFRNRRPYYRICRGR